MLPLVIQVTEQSRATGIYYVNVLTTGQTIACSFRETLPLNNATLDSETLINMIGKVFLITKYTVSEIKVIVHHGGMFEVPIPTNVITQEGNAL